MKKKICLVILALVWLAVYLLFSIDGKTVVSETETLPDTLTTSALEPYYSQVELSAQFTDSVVHTAPPTPVPTPEPEATDPREEYYLSMDYKALMFDAVRSFDPGMDDWYLAWESERNDMIDYLDLVENKFSFEDFRLMSYTIDNELGSNWVPYKYKCMVGSVLLNRTYSPEFADTIHDCLASPGQYPWFRDSYRKVPQEDCMEAAWEVLAYGSQIPASVVFQAEFHQGSGVYDSYYDKWMDTTTYFCYSSHPELYEVVEE